jgi:hypothetical protein
MAGRSVDESESFHSSSLPSGTSLDSWKESRPCDLAGTKAKTRARALPTNTPDEQGTVKTKRQYSSLKLSGLLNRCPDSPPGIVPALAGLHLTPELARFARRWWSIQSVPGWILLDMIDDQHRHQPPFSPHFQP